MNKKLNITKSLKRNNKRYSVKKKTKIKEINCKNFDNKLTGKSNKLDLLGEGSYGIAFLGCLDQLCEESIGVKFLVLKKKYDFNHSHPGIVEVLVGKKLSNLYYKNITPHINLVYKGFTCTLKDIAKSPTLNKSSWYLDKIKDSSFNKNCYKQVMVIFNEKADTDFKKYVIERYENGNPLSDLEHLACLFQFCYTIACAQFHIPGFRHNDIKPNNLLISLNKAVKNTYDVYKIFGLTFYLPTLDFTLKLHDFDFCNSDEFPNQKIHSYKETIFKQIGATPFNNPVYDLHEYINFYYRDLDYTFKNQSTYNLFKKLVPASAFGQNNTHTNRYKLTNIKETELLDNLSDEERYNYIPNDMHTPSELILSFTKFKDFKKPKGEFTIANTYVSNIPSLNNQELQGRTDMFNIMLK
tara:strand:+ start:494 stop:1726 length:1233 start_codon:yes stop_codon:yes gene_type:complete